MTNDSDDNESGVEQSNWFQEMVAASSTRLARAPEASQTAWYKEHQAEKERGLKNNH
jgi:hypothetical protein